MRTARYNIGDLVRFTTAVEGQSSMLGIITDFSYRYTKDEDVFMVLIKGRHLYVRAHQLELVSKAQNNNE